ncbi:MAG: hypothetical protein II353_05725 [Alistipes sp.]|nr:hypothetical protein [Alistipes sp.]
MKKTIIISLVSLFLSTSIFAQQAEEQKLPEKQAPTVEQIAKRNADRMREQYLLGKDQYDKVYKLCLKQAKKDEARHKEIKSEREQMAKDMKGILNDAQWERYEKNQKRPAMLRHQKQGPQQRGFMMRQANKRASFGPMSMKGRFQPCHQMGNCPMGKVARFNKRNMPFAHPQFKSGKPMMPQRPMMKANEPKSEVKNEAEKSVKETNENSKE